MAIIVQSSAPDRTEDALTLVNQVLTSCKLKEVETIEGDAVALETKKALEFLNDREQELLDEAGQQFGHATGEADMDTRLNTKPTGFLNMLSDPTIEGYKQLAYTTLDNLQARESDIMQLGYPAEYYDYGNTIGLFPAPSEDFLHDRYCYVSGWYVCINPHLSGDNHLSPGDGNAGDWAQSTADPREQYSDGTVDLDADYRAVTDWAWESGKNYGCGRLSVIYRQGLTIMAANSDGPTLPSQFYPALKAGAALDLMTHLDHPAKKLQLQQAKYNKLKYDRMLDRRFSQSPPSERVHNPL